MPFVFQAPHNPYVGSISELMLAPAEARARALEQTGQAQANAALMSGQAWANAAYTMGNAAQHVAGAVADHYSPQTQLQQMALEKAKEQQAGQQRIDQLMTPYTPNGPQPEGEGPAKPQQPYLGADGLYDVPKLGEALAASGMGHLAPELLKSAQQINDSIIEHQQRQAKVADAEMVMYGDMADGITKLVKAGTPFDQALQIATAPGLATGRINPQQFAPIAQQLLSMPDDQRMAALGSLMDAAEKVAGDETLGKDAEKITRYGRVKASNVVPEKPTEASIAYDLTSPDPVKQERARAAMAALKPDTIKPGTIESWVKQSRDLAAKEKGSPLTPEETFAIDGKAVASFKQLSKDPDMQALIKSNEELRNTYLRLQNAQQPTKEDAEPVAKMILNHQMAPSQLSAFGGFGAAGSSFKRLVGLAIAKEDPNFNWEEAEADYQFVKSPSFQGTIRFMESATESLPRLIENGKALQNGQVRSINSLINAGKKEFNNVALGKFKTDVIFVGDEIGKIIKGGGTGSPASDQALAQAKEVFDTSDDPDVLVGKMEEVQALLGYRRKSLTRGTYLDKGPTTAAPTAAPKTLSVQDIQRIADLAKTSYADAKKHAESNGYTVK